jgi:hypothetical protein
MAAAWLDGVYVSSEYSLAERQQAWLCAQGIGHRRDLSFDDCLRHLQLEAVPAPPALKIVQPAGGSQSTRASGSQRQRSRAHQCAYHRRGDSQPVPCSCSSGQQQQRVRQHLHASNQPGTVQLQGCDRAAVRVRPFQQQAVSPGASRSALLSSTAQGQLYFLQV